MNWTSGYRIKNMGKLIVNNIFYASTWTKRNLMLVTFTSNYPQLQVNCRHCHPSPGVFADILKYFLKIHFKFSAIFKLVGNCVCSAECQIGPQHASSLHCSIETLLCDILFPSVLMIFSLSVCLSVCVFLLLGACDAFWSTKGILLNESLWWWLCKFNLFMYVCMCPSYFTSIHLPLAC